MRGFWRRSAVLLAAFFAVTGCASAAEEIEEPPAELYAAAREETPSPDWVTALPQAQDASVKQLFIVAGMGMDLTTATVSMHERGVDGSWRQILSTPAFVGRNGLCPDAEHREGCGQTPLGGYRFNRAFGIAEDPGCSIPYVMVDDGVYWSGDMNEGMCYNQLVRLEEHPGLDLESCEHIIDYALEYRYCLNISFNEEGAPGRGSAIFLHCFGAAKPETGGCVAVPEYIMRQVLERVDPDCVVLIDTFENLNASF